jgi:ribosomal protein S18 acetylase RimI-like enzyme
VSQTLELEYRRLTPELAPGLARLFAALAEQGDDQFFHPHPLTAEEARRLCGLRGEDLYYAAVASRTVLAYGMLRGWDEGYAMPSLGIAVHPRARGSGLALSFMQFLHAAAVARGASRIRLKVYPENRGARKLYEKLGYRFGETAADNQLVGVLSLGDPSEQAAGRLARRISDHLSWSGPAPAGEPAPDIWAALQPLLGRPEEEFVRGLYSLLLGRAADTDGLINNLAALAAGASRADVIRSIAGSEECRAGGTDISWLSRLDQPQPAPAAAPAGPLCPSARPEGEAQQATTPASSPAGPLCPSDGELLSIPDRAEFVSQAYRALLGRPPSAEELRKQCLRLRFLPFYSRRLVLRRLRDCEEKRQYDREAAAERVREAAARQQCAHDLRVQVRDLLAALSGHVQSTNTSLAALSGHVQSTNTSLAALSGHVQYTNASLAALLGAVREGQLECFTRALLNGDPRYADPRRLQRHEHEAFSQTGEDGILQEIFRRLGTTNRHFVEFGVEGGLECNTANLLLQGWSGLWIEPDQKAVAAIRAGLELVLRAGRLRLLCEAVTAENVEALFAAGGVPEEPDLVSIDIDGNDYWVWRALRRYRPRVVVLEYNPIFPPPTEWVMPYDPAHRWDRSAHFGASLRALQRLAEAKGYALVGCNLTGVNAFFVRQDLVGDKFAAPFTAENHYEPPRLYLLWRQQPGLARNYELFHAPPAPAA